MRSFPRLLAGRSADCFATFIARGDERSNVALYVFVAFAAVPLELLSASDVHITAPAGERAQRLKGGRPLA